MLLDSKANAHDAGLQTPRLKRLAEIVSQQAIAQQEKMEFEHVNGDIINGQPMIEEGIET